MATGGLTLDDDPDACSLCLDSFQNPKFLPCHHTFCASCIQDVARRHSPGPFPCPHCRKPTTLPQDGVSGLQGNFYVKPKDRKVYCRVHHDEKLKYFCIDCEEVVCCECRLTSHIHHAAHGIDSVITQKKADLKAYKGRLKTAGASLARQLDTAHRQRQNVQHGTDSLEKILRERHAAAVRHADQLLAQGLAFLQTYKDSLAQRQDDGTRQDRLQKINDKIKELDNLVTNSSATDVLAVTKEMRNGRRSERDRVLDDVQDPLHIFPPFLDRVLDDDQDPLHIFPPFPDRVLDDHQDPLRLLTVRRDRGHQVKNGKKNKIKKNL